MRLTDSRRRKVRCNEIFPRCSHCQRLNLECKWKTAAHDPSLGQASPMRASNHRGRLMSDSQAQSSSSNISDVPLVTVDGHFNDVFNYASFMWNGGDLWNSSPDWSDPESNQTDQYNQINFSVCQSCHKASEGLLRAHIDMTIESIAL